MIYPENGVRINDQLSLDFPSIHSLFEIDSAEKKDFSQIIDNDFDIDSIELSKNAKIDSLKMALEADSIRNWQLQLHYPNGDKSVLYPFFTELEKKNSKKPIRIMHYGDSQIEGDRITGYLRNKLQSKFGGSGPGLIPAVPLVRSAAFEYEASENWKRYTLYGKVDTLVTHKKYGPLVNFGRFSPILSDSILRTPEFIDSIFTGTITYKKSRLSYGTTKVFYNYQLLFGNNKKQVTVKTLIEDSIIQERTFLPSKGLHVLQGNQNKPIESISFKFEGGDSPDVYGVNLEGKGGVIVDNIALRGSSGTLFRKMDSNLLSKTYNLYDIKLLILQFGGNVMPYIDSEKECLQYGRWFESQLQYLKNLIPGVSIIVIGPSDMGTMENGEYNSYPLLPNVRDALKTATFNKGGVYWDMMEAMGGMNSMEAWVDATPALAGKDYVHFNLRGAGKIAQMFYNALIKDYNEFQTKKSE